MLGGRWQILLWSHDAKVSLSDPVLIQNVPEDSTDWSNEILVAMHVLPQVKVEIREDHIVHL